MTTATISSALDALGKAFAADPQKARSKPAPATARLAEGLRFEITGLKGERMVTDMPAPMGGGASAPSPGWYFRGALASCTATVIAMRAARDGIELSHLEVSVDSDSDHRGLLGVDERIGAGFSALRMRVKLGAPGVPAEKLRALAQWAEAHSPVGCTVCQPPPLSVEIEVAS